MIFGEKEMKDFNEATDSWICKIKIDQDDKKNCKVRDHCHFTGRYRGAAHRSCNLRYTKHDFTPVLFHNFSGYDSHSFIKNLGFTDGNIDCIPNNEERYISFTKKIQVGTYKKIGNGKYEIKHLHHQIRFIDSFKFMSSSLDKLASNLIKEDLKNLKNIMKEINSISLLEKEFIFTII